MHRSHPKILRPNQHFISPAPLAIESVFDKGYVFNGKEKDNEINVNGGSFPMAIGIRARIYDSRLGRWLSLDPHYFNYPFYSVYNFCNSSPIKIVDKDGKDVILSGIGSKDEPYIITATYVYIKETLTDEIVKGLKGAVSLYSKNTFNYLNDAGKKVFIKYNLNVVKIKDKAEYEKEKENYNFKTKDGADANKCNYCIEFAELLPTINGAKMLVETAKGKLSKDTKLSENKNGDKKTGTLYEKIE